MNKFPSLVSTFFALWLLGACTPEKNANQDLPHPVEDDTRQLNDALADYTDNYLGWHRNTYQVTGENVGACTPGTVSTGMQDTLLQRVNYYRRLCGLDMITLNAEANASIQAAALMFQANNSASSNPPSTWQCYTAAADSAAQRCRLSGSAKGTEAIDFWMQDTGAGNTACANRRWILYTRATQFGVGGNDRYTLLCTADHYQDKPGLPDYVAWPPARFIPSPLVPSRWSFSQPGADFSTCTIEMSGPAGSSPVVLQKNFINPNFGDATVTWDIANLPLPPPGGLIKYQVSINGVRKDNQTRNYAYVVSVFNPIR
ncbi:MAG: CAP domain-containing protein [Bacteroidetes bacterium]|nr:CAP domain-containing protein [Bacteroidota bacterium]